LNGLGERDVKVLAAHAVKHPGEISVHKGREPAAMYDARVQSVTRMLAKYGVPADTIKIVDKLPGGEGEVDSYRAVLILNRSYMSTPLTGENGGHTLEKGAKGPAMNDAGVTKP